MSSRSETNVSVRSIDQLLLSARIADRDLTEALLRYDASGDHVRGHYGDDCVRCKIAKALEALRAF